MIELGATVRNSAGIHCRPSTVIVGAVRDYEGVISVRSGVQECDLRSVMGLLMLELQEGAAVTVRVEGAGEAEMCRTLVTLLETRFDFPPKID